MSVFEGNYDSILRIRDITLLTKVRIVNTVVFPVQRHVSWTIKTAEWRGSDAFELWGWRRLLRVPWTARRSNQSLLKEITLNIHWKDWCWSWSSNTIATRCKGLTGKDPDAGKDRRGWQMMRCLNGIMDVSLRKLRETVKDREAWRATVDGVSKSCTWLSNWTIKSRKQEPHLWLSR